MPLIELHAHRLDVAEAAAARTDDRGDAFRHAEAIDARLTL